MAFALFPRPLNRIRLSRPLLAALMAGLGLSLSACAPRTTTKAVPSVQAVTPVSSVSFYPQQVGLQWTYMPEGDLSSDTPYVLRELGPTIFAGQNVMATQMSGRGAEQTWYRVRDASGQRLLGFRKPGVTISLTPPWQEYPAEKDWRVGLSWSGTSKILMVSDDGKDKVEGTLQYRYDVQDQRQVKTPAGTFGVWVVTRRVSDDLGGLFPDTQQFWFAPFVGDVRTPEGLLMTSRNFSSKGIGK